MEDEKNENPDIYPLRDHSALIEAFVQPPKDAEIFGIQSSPIRVTLGAGISLCDAYRLDKQLSQNAAGETWQAGDLAASRNVIVYLPPLPQRVQSEAMQPAAQAARHIEALEHPRIVPLLQHLTDPEHGFFTVRKFVNGQTLDVYRKEYIKKHKKIAPAKVVKILSDIAHALDYAHGARIFHGDLCPDNIIIGLDDEVYVNNFALMPMPPFNIASKKPFQAPELIAETPPTAASDVYALAVIAYQMLSYRIPLSSEPLNDTPLPLPNVPSEVDAVIRKAMTKDPLERFSSCGEFVRTLESSFQQSARIKPVVVTPLKSTPGKKIPSAIWFGGAFAAVLCVTGIAIWNTQPAGQESPAANSAPVPNVVAKVEQAVKNKPIPVTAPKKQPLAPEPKIETAEPEPPVIIQPELDTQPAPEIVAEVSPEITESTPIPETEPPSLPPLPPQQPNGSEEVLEDIVQNTPPVPSAVSFEEGTEKQISIGGFAASFRCCKSDSGFFWIQETPVTWEMWNALMESTPEDNPVNQKLPVTKVSWTTCQDFVMKLNDLAILSNDELNGSVFSLPTESQWEHAKPYDHSVNPGFSEWCADWHDTAEQIRSVRGSGNYRNGRDPTFRRGYDHIGFRLVIRLP